MLRAAVAHAAAWFELQQLHWSHREQEWWFVMELLRGNCCQRRESSCRQPLPYLVWVSYDFFRRAACWCRQVPACIMQGVGRHVPLCYDQMLYRIEGSLLLGQVLSTVACDLCWCSHLASHTLLYVLGQRHVTCEVCSSLGCQHWCMAWPPVLAWSTGCARHLNMIMWCWPLSWHV